MTTFNLDGLWRDNAALVQLLGLCPLLAVSNSAVNALGLGIATLLVLLGSNVLVSLFRRGLGPAIRLPAFVLTIAAFTTCAELLTQAYAIELYRALGIFIPLIVTNCMILSRAEIFASRNPPLPALWDGLTRGLGFAAALLALGMIRELLGTGAIFANMDLLLPFAADWRIAVVPDYRGFLLALLPPGAFLCLGLLIALKNIMDGRRHGASSGTKSRPAGNLP